MPPVVAARRFVLFSVPTRTGLCVIVYQCMNEHANNEAPTLPTSFLVADFLER